ncbi:hypothetical protein DFJ74DRAFT_648160 [Hyaloraphidium curvatum]|nr:hypothetical protein DFJ74DRAFT_648160 [Hyaloraphidium curvatum]
MSLVAPAAAPAPPAGDAHSAAAAIAAALRASQPPPPPIDAAYLAALLGAPPHAGQPAHTAPSYFTQAAPAPLLFAYGMPSPAPSPELACAGQPLHPAEYWGAVDTSLAALGGLQSWGAPALAGWPGDLSADFDAYFDCGDDAQPAIQPHTIDPRLIDDSAASLATLFDPAWGDAMPADIDEALRFILAGSADATIAPQSLASPPLSPVFDKPQLPARSSSADTVVGDRLPGDDAPASPAESSSGSEYRSAGTRSRPARQRKQPQSPVRSRGGGIARHKKHACPTCGAAFFSSGHLSRHKYIHEPAEKKPHPCPIPGCGRRFARSDNMKVHYKSHLLRVTAAAGGAAPAAEEADFGEE